MGDVKQIEVWQYDTVVAWSQAGLLPQLAARVLLALDGFYRDVMEAGYKPEFSAARHGLPVDEPQPCPECGGCREIPNRQYCLVDRCTVTTCPDHYGHCPVSKPCPTCQGGR